MEAYTYDICTGQKREQRLPEFSKREGREGENCGRRMSMLPEENLTALCETKALLGHFGVVVRLAIPSLSLDLRPSFSS